MRERRAESGEVGGDGEMHNVFSGSADAVVQADTVHGGVHIHPPRGRSTDATRTTALSLYAKAADQLGSTRAPVRLAGMHTLQQVAQADPGQRQAVTDLLCAYLRTPYSPPERFDEQIVADFLIARRRRSRGKPPAANNQRAIAAYRDQMGEYEVRLAAQRLLANRLRPGDPADPASTPWTGIDLDLTGATLVDFSLERCTVRSATFEAAVFLGHSDFTRAVFAGEADFRFARFADSGTIARFQGARFARAADFTAATFRASAAFAKARFDGPARFSSCAFNQADFMLAAFAHTADFRDTRFGHANFSFVTFGFPDFYGATFPRLHTSFLLAHPVPPEAQRFASPEALRSLWDQADEPA
jgi:uncharacterized protein YjbI with pentapeptide repeats